MKSTFGKNNKQTLDVFVLFTALQHTDKNAFYGEVNTTKTAMKR